jgi:putative transposase
MARLARLVVPGYAHLVQWRSLAGLPAWVNGADQAAFAHALQQALAEHRLALHAYALRRDEMLLLARPTAAGQLSACVQAVGRRYVRAYNLRHGRSGTLWNGRFRSCVVEPGAATLWALRYIEQTPAGLEPEGLCSAYQRVGQTRATQHVAVVQPPEYWALGNTPFDRESGYRALLEEPLPPGPCAALARSLSGGWPLGSPAFTASLASLAARPLAPRARGRPPKPTDTTIDVSPIFL